MDGSVNTYTWVLEIFLDAMNNKTPLFVIINEDKMRHKVIKRIFLVLSWSICLVYSTQCIH